jgi:hypothetical protein
MAPGVSVSILSDALSRRIVEAWRHVVKLPVPRIVFVNNKCRKGDWQRKKLVRTNGEDPRKGPAGLYPVVLLVCPDGDPVLKQGVGELAFAIPASEGLRLNDAVLHVPLTIYAT